MECLMFRPLQPCSHPLAVEMGAFYNCALADHVWLNHKVEG